MDNLVDLSADEMVNWANANMERVEELEKTIERLQARVDVLEGALNNIARNSMDSSTRGAAIAALAATEKESSDG